MFDDEPSDFKKGIADEETVLTVTVSVELSPVILIKPDCARVNVSVFESADTTVEPSGIAIFLNTSLAPLAAIVKVSPLIEVVTPVPPATFKVSFAKSKVVVVELSSEIVKLPLADELIVNVSPLIEVVTFEPPAIFRVSPAVIVVTVEVSSVKDIEFNPSTNSLIVIASPFAGAVPKVKV